MVKKTVKIECNACGATGLYSGFAEPRGTAVVCRECGGTGCKEISFTPFTRRKDKRGITTIRQSRGTFIDTGVGPTGRSITYQEFQQGKMP